MTASFPDWLYHFNPRDEQVTSLEPVEFYSTQLISAAALVDFNAVSGATYIVPESRVLLINSWVIEATPGASQQAQLIELTASARYSGLAGSHFPLNPIPIERTILQNPGAGLFTGVGKTLGPAIVTGGGTVGATVTFNAGAANNMAQFFFRGILIPRGNFSF